MLISLQNHMFVSARDWLSIFFEMKMMKETPEFLHFPAEMEANLTAIQEECIQSGGL
jgi:hypothetical protein